MKSIVIVLPLFGLFLADISVLPLVNFRHRRLSALQMVRYQNRAWYDTPHDCCCMCREIILSHGCSVDICCDILWIPFIALRVTSTLRRALRNDKLVMSVKDPKQISVSPCDTL